MDLMLGEEHPGFLGAGLSLSIAMGSVLIRRIKVLEIPSRSQIAESSVFLISLIIGLMGLINISAVISPALAGQFSFLTDFSPFYIGGKETFAGFFLGLGLLIDANGLWRRKRVAWFITLSLLIFAATSYLVRGSDYQNAGFAILLGVWILLLRPYYKVASDPKSLQRGILTLLGALPFTMALGVSGFYLLGRQSLSPFDSWEALRQTAVMVTRFSDPGLHPLSGLSLDFGYSIYLVGGIAYSYALVMALRPVQPRPETAETRQVARYIVERFGCSSMAYLALLDDKTYYFSSGGSLIAYTVRGRVAVTMSDPIGPIEDVPAAIEGFQQLCARNDWTPSFCLTLPAYQEHYQNAGFKLICMGHEAVIDLHTFSLSGRANSTFRKRYNRFLREGYQVIFHQPPIPTELIKEFRLISDEWLKMTYGSEKRFFLGWFDEEIIRNSVIAAVHSPDGEISAFANIVPEFQLNETTVDLMRYREDAESGTMDFMFVSLFHWAKEKGFDTFNLGLCASVGVGEKPEDPLPERILHYIYKNWAKYYNFIGLRGFKEKFHPYWVPEYLVYPNLISLPSVWIAMARANSGDFEPWGYFKRRPRMVPRRGRSPRRWQSV